MSPATLMRRVRAEGPDILRIGRARATRYGLVRPWIGLEATRFPLVRISEDGGARAEGELLTVAGGQSVVMAGGPGGPGDVHHGLPIELVDNRPAGFLGRHFAARFPELRLPPRLEDWSDHHILLALSRRGEDLPGSLIIGGRA